jgi:hypothetical protein
MMVRTLAIVKFASAERIESFLNGEVFMNTLGYFAALENDPLRADEREGDSLWLHDAKLSIGSKDGEFTLINGLITQFDLHALQIAN